MRHLSVYLLTFLGFASGAALAQDLTLYDSPTDPEFSLTPAPPLPPANLGSFNIIINAGSGLAGNAAALAAFNRAAQQWESFISDPITITIDADLGSLGPGIIGSANSVALQGSYTLVRNALVADAADEADDGVVAFLPTAAQFTATIPLGSTLSGNVTLTKANAKALGFTGLDSMFGVSDGTITFSDAFAFDYDNSDGVMLGFMDFETVAAHEIGHILGFFSGVDNADAGATTVQPTTLDLFRFADGGASDPSNTATFTTASRNMVPGANAIFDDLDNEWRMSTGRTLGDGRQASHWKDDSLTGINIGIMDPTLALGVSFNITAADLRALDGIGYEIVPEPSSMLLIAASGVAILAFRRRKGHFSPSK